MLEAGLLQLEVASYQAAPHSPATPRRCPALRRQAGAEPCATGHQPEPVGLPDTLPGSTTNVLQIPLVIQASSHRCQASAGMAGEDPPGGREAGGVTPQGGGVTATGRLHQDRRPQPRPRRRHPPPSQHPTGGPWRSHVPQEKEASHPDAEHGREGDADLRDVQRRGAPRTQLRRARIGSPSGAQVSSHTPAWPWTP
jgi:hypothetical protein